jgi:hypothetical protein
MTVNIASCTLDFEFCDTWYHRQLGPYIPIDLKSEVLQKRGCLGLVVFSFLTILGQCDSIF